jgi:hypothetical protein
MLAVAALAASVTACSAPTPQVSPPPKPAEPPVVLQATQLERILQELSADLEKSAAESSADPLEGRVAGAALAMVQAQLAAKAANPDEKTAFELGTRFADGQIVARSQVWPRSFAVVTDSAETEAPFIYQLEQADARSPYKLVLWARMLAGATLPPTAAAGVGSAVVDPGSPDLQVTPIAAVQAYAAAKDDPTGDQADLFDTVLQDGVDPDSARARWTALAQAYRGGITQFADGQVQTSSALIEGSVSALATADGGALVFGQVKSVMDLVATPPAGEYIDMGSQSYTGLGAQTLQMTKSARIEHLQTVVLAVPSKDAPGSIRVIAVADLPTAVQVE